MKKLFAGLRLKRLREERGMTQAALATSLGISASYLNQLENNQRPLTAPVLLQLSEVLGLDVQAFSEGEETRLIADLREAFADPAAGEAIGLAEIREVAAAMPALGREIAALHQRYRQAVERVDALAMQLGGGGEASLAAPAPYEEVRDFFYTHHNYFGEIDEYAEDLSGRIGLEAYLAFERLCSHFELEHDIRVMIEPRESSRHLRVFDARRRVIHMSSQLDASQRAFQLATQLGLLELDGVIDTLAQRASLSSPEARALARVGLANYFAGALLMPYRRFLAAAEAERYDIERLGHLLGTSFEMVCHRLSAMQRSGATGVPFFFIRVDRAGNISKRQSATDFHFSRVGGACPLWNVYEAFAQPGRILTQMAQMPDGRTYLWIARTVQHDAGAFGAPGKSFAIGLGCDIRHAGRLVYSKGLNLDDLSAATPIGAGCRVCERPACPQRAFPQIGRAIAVDENRSTFTPYASE